MTLANDKIKQLEIDQVIQADISKNGPGCALGIYQSGILQYGKGFGLADVENNVPITTKTVFDIGSVGKQFTAASLVHLSQKTALSLDDDIRKYIPEMPIYSAPITIKHLLYHTSGIRDYINLLLLSGHDIHDVTTNNDALQILTRQKNTQFKPGTEHRYSNSGYFLIAIIIERLSGLTLGEYAKKYYFQPLKMQSTQYVNSHVKVITDRASAYSEDEAGNLIRDVSYWEQNGDGGLFTTIEDLSLWDAMFYRQDNNSVSLHKAMHKKGHLSNGEELDYALGLAISEYRGVELIQHAGGWGGFRAYFVRAPKYEVSIAILCNYSMMRPDKYATEILDILLKEHLNPPKETSSTVNSNEKNTLPHIVLSQEQYALYTGKYEFAARTGLTIDLNFKQDKLFLNFSRWEDDVVLFPVSETLFVDDKNIKRMQFKLDKHGHVAEATLFEPVTSRPFLVRRLLPYTPSDADIGALEGQYVSDELQVAIELKQEEKILLLISPKGTKHAVQLLDESRFSSFHEMFSLFNIVRNKENKIIGLVLTEDNEEGIGFAKSI